MRTRECSGRRAVRAVRSRGSRALRLAAASLLPAIALAACGNAHVQVTHSGNTDGVFSNKIVVGALASQSGPLPADFAPVVTGAQVYLDMINAEGGVNGRKIVLGPKLDDQSSPSVNASQARALVDQYKVFAVVAVATPSFSGASYLADHSVPTFGLAVNPQWSNNPTLFGNNGSYISFGAPVVPAAFLTDRLHAKRVGVLAYNVAQSQQGCEGMIKGVRLAGITVAYEDLSVPAPASDLHADVNRMKRAGVDTVISCMDLSGNVLLSQTMQQAGMTGVNQLWNDGYDENAVSRYPAAMHDVYFFEPNAPFEVSRLYPGRYPGMDQYLQMLQRYAPGSTPSEASLAGWTSADLFVSGLRAIGRDVTRSRLVEAINKMSAFTANGILVPVDWRVAHTSPGPINCAAFIQEQHGHFVPVIGTAGSPPSVFTCFPVPTPEHGPVDALKTLPPGVPPG